MMGHYVEKKMTVLMTSHQREMEIFSHCRPSDFMFILVRNLALNRTKIRKVEKKSMAEIEKRKCII